MAPMPKKAAAAVDPLSGLTGISLFPRSIRDSADIPLPADLKDLDSISNIMKSLKELRSPEKLMSEAKKIVDVGADLLSNASSFSQNTSIGNDIAAKDKDRPRERRPGLGIVRERDSFSLRTSISHTPANLEPTLDIDNLEDPDAFFDAYEKIEKAKREIQKQLGGEAENTGLQKPAERRRRPGILGKSYTYKHRYSLMSSENDDMLMSSQETVHQDTPSPPKDVPPEKLMDPDPYHDDLEEVELPESMKKSESQVNDLLEELLSYNDEDLEGQGGALNILQQRLNIKTLDMEKPYCLTKLTDIGRTNNLTSSRCREKPCKSSAVIDRALKISNKKPRKEQELVENHANPVSSPTPPRNPFGSMSLLKKKILQPNPLKDPFSPQDFDLCAHPNSSSSQPKDKLPGRVDTPKVISDMNSYEVIGNADSLPEQPRSENAIMQRETGSGSSRANASPPQLMNKLLGEVGGTKDLGIFSEMETNVEFDTTKEPFRNLEIEDVIANADGIPDHFEDVNASISRMDVNSRRNAESDNNIGEAMNTNDKLNPSVVDEEPRADASTKQQIYPEQQEVNAAKRQRGKRVAGAKRVRDAHPMRKSLAEAGTSFETGVRRSKRVSVKPLAYWKGERLLYGRIDNSLKLIGRKYISPGKVNEKLKVEAYISLEKPEYKQLLDLASRH